MWAGLRRAKSALLLTLLLVPLLGFALNRGAYYVFVPSREDALRVFVEYGKPGEWVTEDMLMDPLIVARGDVVPDVLAAIAVPSMPKRRYALAFLGNSGRREAIPHLERILRDDREKDIFRGDALSAIAMIDGALGRRLAAEFADQPEYLGFIARDVQDGNTMPHRTYETALDSFLCVRLTGC